MLKIKELFSVQKRKFWRIALVLSVYSSLSIAAEMSENEFDKFQQGIYVCLARMDCRIIAMRGIDNKGMDTFSINRYEEQGKVLRAELSQRDEMMLKKTLASLQIIPYYMTESVPNWTMDAEIIVIKLISGPAHLDYRNYVYRTNSEAINEVCGALSRLKFK